MNETREMLNAKGKKILNIYTMNEAIAMLKKATEQEKDSRFVLQCEHCTISIVANNMYGEAIEIALRSVDDSTWLALHMSDYVEDRPIIRGLPLICFPALARQFKNIESEAMPVVWDAWDTIADYM